MPTSCPTITLIINKIHPKMNEELHAQDMRMDKKIPNLEHKRP